MLIKYKKKNFIVNLIIGLVWISLFVITITLGEKVHVSDYFYLFLGTVYVSLAFYNKHYQYLKVKNNIITNQNFPKKRFDLNKLSRVYRKFGDIELHSKTQKSFKINPDVIDKNSLIELNSILDAYETKIAS